MENTSVIPAQFNTPQDNYPFPAPFILSSTERDWCRFQQNRNAAIVFIKRRHLEENLKTFARELGMDESEQKRFLDWWCCANGEEIRAEGDPYFELRYRAENWMEKRKLQSKPQQQSRIEQYAQVSQNLTGIINDLFADSDNGPTAGPSIPPDEQ